MRILILDSYYPDFLKEVYARHPTVSTARYATQWRYIMDQCFGTADFYSRNLRAIGHEASEAVINCQPLQEAWATEMGQTVPRSVGARRVFGARFPWVARNWACEIAWFQVEDFKPDVILVQDPVGLNPKLLTRIRSRGHFLVAQIASQIESLETFRAYDLVLSSFPHFVVRFNESGIRSHYFRLGFEPTVLSLTSSLTPSDVVFVGGFSRVHSERMRFFEALSELCPFEWWGYGCEELSPDSPLKSRYRGNAWGLEMYKVLAGSRIALNHHIDVAATFANNMRLYEATGVGAMLLTDDKDNLSNLFEVGREIVSYRNVDECAQHIEHFLQHDDARTAVAAAGQARTLRDHTYYSRMNELSTLLEHYVP